MDHLCYPRVVCHLHDLPACIRNCRPTPRLLDGIRGNITTPLPHNSLLGLGRRNTGNVSNPRLCLEIVNPPRENVF